MTAPVPITRADCTSVELHDLARECKSAPQARRLRAIALVLDGWPRSQVARALGTAAHRAAVASWVEGGPDLETDGVSRWRLAEIRDKVLANFHIGFCLESIRRLLRSLGFSPVSPRPVHPSAVAAKQAAFRLDFRRLAPDAAPKGTDPEGIEIWLQDEARAGQKGMLSRVWARKGSRPRVVRDHRYGYAVLFAAARPANPVAVGRVCDRANADEMNRHLADIAAAVPPGRHAVLVPDGAGWHRAKRLEVPANISSLRLPPYSPELNPMENVFAFLKGTFLANPVFATVEEVRDGIASACPSFRSDPERIASITTRKWANCTGESPS